MNGFQWMHQVYPRNFLFRKPFVGAIIIIVFAFLFLVLYQPLDAHAGYFLGYEATMAAYCIFSGLALIMAALIINKTPYFSPGKIWTVGKELMAVFIALMAMGLSIFLAAFLLEPPADRWNVATLMDSVSQGILVGVIPLGFFSLIYARIWFSPAYVLVTKESIEGSAGRQVVDKVSISSQLKKESLDFNPQQFIYAESDGNYVHFFLEDDQKVVSKVIRNSMSKVEEDLSHVDYIIRVHRAFMVNLHKVSTKKGNSLGYLLKLSGIKKDIPVSRTKTREFNQRVKDLS